MAQEVVFDGHRINDLFFVGDISVGLPEFLPTVEERVSDGSRVRGTRLGTVAISIPLVVRPSQGTTARAALSALVSWLDVDGPRELSLSGDGGLTRMCVPSGAPQVLDARWNDRVVVTLTQVDPALYGERREVTVPSGGSVTALVGGDYPTRPTVTASAATRGASNLWGVSADGSQLLRVAVRTGSAVGVEVDCGARTCRVSGIVTAPTLDSDWISLSPGTHVVRNDVGSGGCVVAWRERWHR